MKITQEKLNSIIASHGKWLRDEEDAERADFRYANLRGTELSGADLRCANLNDADLRGANLSSASLRYANLICADLRGANFNDADLRGADLNDADLRGANFRGADLSGADLSSASLNKTYYQITHIGSRNATTTYCIEDDNVFCGCWNHYRGGTLEEFRKRIKSVYGENGETPNKKYYAQYTAAIEFFEQMAKLAKKEEEK